MKVGDVFVRMALDNKDYRRGLDREEGFTRQKAMTLGSIFSKGFSVALGIGLIHGFKTVGGLLTNLITTAAKTETFDVAMQAVARSSGYPIPVLQEQRKEVMALGIAEQEATQMLTRFMQAQLDTANATRIARIAQDAGTLAAINSSEAADRMTEAIAKQRPELLTAFGFTRNLNDIYGDYARTVGKTANSLSEVEKKQAMLNYIFKEGEKIAGSYEAAMGTVGKQMGSLEKLELSKKLMQELKTAFAKPVLLPAFGFWVETMHNALGRLKDWMEANQALLLSWGMTAKNALAAIVRGVQWVTNAFIKNWGVIRFAATAFLTYVMAAKTINIVSFAVRGLTLLLWALRGHAFSTSGYLGVLAASVRTYQAASLGAAGATNIFTYTIHAATAAVKGFLASIPVVGWILLALSAIVGGGVALWSKYSASVRAANDAAREAKMKELADQQLSAAKAAMKAAKGETKLGDAIGKAGKAATKTLMPFDEIHTIQKDMAGLGEIGDLDIPGFDMPAADMPGFDFDMGDFFSGIEDAKPTFKGFLGWIWDSIKSWGSGVKKWLLGWAGPLWDKVKESWGNFTAWASDLWGRVKTKWEEFKTWCSETWQALWTPIQDKWERFKTWAGNLWEGAKTKWEAFKADIKRRWEAFWTPIKNKWLTFTGWAEGIWSRIKTEWDKIKKWSLWAWIKSKIDWLKGIFDFKWSLPKIKMPHFTLSWSTSGFWGGVGEFLGLPGKPNIGVSWYAKGGVFDKPSLIGVGEAGKEAVLPLDQNTGWMDDLADKINSTGGGEGPLTVQLIVGGEKILEEVIDAAARKNARAGKTVLQMGV